MAKRILEGLWDCKYCDTKAIGGLIKTCPCCGHPQDTDTKFYLGEKKNYLEEELAAQYGQGPDWVCPYCNSLNRNRFTFCSACGAPKEEAEDDYYSNRKKEEAKAEEKQQKIAAAGGVGGASENNEVKSGGGKKPVLLIVILLAIIGLLAFKFWPRNYKAEVRTAGWAREIDIEAYRTVQESDWSVPSGGRAYSQKQEVHHYVQVLDHYETRSRQVAEQVYDGEDTHTSYSDNGDGTFTEETWTTPRYRTEYRTEYYNEPIYRNDPVFATKYYYEIERWLPDREEKSSGADIEPYWPEYTLADNERTGYTGEVYNLIIKHGDDSYTVFLPYDRWKEFKAGDKVDITVVSGKVTKLNGQDVG